jgi:signal transduction histidine kinase
LKKIGLLKNVKVGVSVECDAAMVVAHSIFINRIIHNLVNNAVQALPKGRKITIDSSIEAKGVSYL